MLSKTQRNEQMQQLTAQFGSASAVYLTAYEGITVEKISELRIELRKVGAKFVVVKNTLAAKAFEANEIKGLEGFLKGPVGIAVAADDSTGPAKIIKAF